MFTFTFSGSRDFNNERISLISYIPGGEVYPIVFALVYSTSNRSVISLYVSSYRPYPQDLDILLFLIQRVFHF